MRGRTVVAAKIAFVAGAISLFGCGSDDTATSGRAGSAAPSASQVSSELPQQQSVSPQELKLAVRTYSAAFLGGDADGAYNMLSARCRNRVARDEFAAVVSRAHDQYGSAAMRTLTVDAVAEGLARVSYKYDVGAIDQESEPWVVEDGAWREDDC